VLNTRCTTALLLLTSQQFHCLHVLNTRCTTALLLLTSRH
jgi:hypothetical protein